MKKKGVVSNLKQMNVNLQRKSPPGAFPQPYEAFSLPVYRTRTKTPIFPPLPLPLNETQPSRPASLGSGAGAENRARAARPTRPSRTAQTPSLHPHPHLRLEVDTAPQGHSSFPHTQDYVRAHALVSFFSHRVRPPRGPPRGKMRGEKGGVLDAKTIPGALGEGDERFVHLRDFVAVAVAVAVVAQ